MTTTASKAGYGPASAFGRRPARKSEMPMLSWNKPAGPVLRLPQSVISQPVQAGVTSMETNTHHVIVVASILTSIVLLLIIAT